MKIVFWSPLHGQTKQSSNMLALTLMLAMNKKKRILMTQTQFCMNDLEDVIVGRTGTRELRERFYQDMGIDALNRCIKRKQLEKSDLTNCCVQILNEPELLLLPGARAGSYEIHSESLRETIGYLLSEAEKYFDFVMADTNPGNDGVSRLLMEEADVVVVNLSQNIGLLDSFFSNFPEELKGKEQFYLFGAYLRDSCYNLHNLRLRYRSINRRNSAVIPMNVRFMDAVSGGRVVDFFETNIECEAGESNYGFMQEVKNASDRLLRLAEKSSGFTWK